VIPSTYPYFGTTCDIKKITTLFKSGFYKYFQSAGDWYFILAQKTGPPFKQKDIGTAQ